MELIVGYACIWALASALPHDLSNTQPANPLPIGGANAVVALPSPGSAGPNPIPSTEVAASSPVVKVAEIIKDERENNDDGSYSVDFETSDGVVSSQSGSPGRSAEGAFIQQGSISFTHPGGETFSLKYVADENGFQPESPNLPVAPDYPFPIPQFVLDQIAFAEEEDRLAAEKGAIAPANASGAK